MPFTVKLASAALNPEGIAKFSSDTDSDIEKACSTPVPPVSCIVKLLPEVSRATTCAVIPKLASLIAFTTPVGVAEATETVFVVWLAVPIVKVRSKEFPPLML